MQIESLGYLSETIFTDFDGRVDDRGSYLAIHTLSNPNFFWGNLLLFKNAPKAGDFKIWQDLFKKEFTHPDIYHQTFAWEEERKGDCTEFLQAGFELEAKIVLATSQPEQPVRWADNLEICPITSETDWEAMIQLQLASASPHLPKEEWEKFYRKQKIRYQNLHRAGKGSWFGGYYKGELVTGLGIFHNGKIGRYQTVATHPSYLRRGYAGTLVFLAAQFALREWELEQLVICADPDYFARKIYESVGFRPVKTEYGLCWWAKKTN
jgi:RimJ/RimL family protein N-acetyltransferase